MRTLFRPALVLALVSGCTLANLTPQARFSESAHVLNDASRWGHVDMAVEHVSPQYVERFLERHRDWGSAVSIADAELVRMQVGEDRKSAMSEVSVSWYRSDGVTVRTSLVTQTWKVDRGQFRLVDETVRAGDAGLFAEPPKDG